MAARSPGICKITNKITGKIYVGSSNNIHRRWIEHRSELRRGVSLNHRLQNAWNKYGEISFLFEVQEFVDESNLIEREQYWLDYYKSYDRKIGFNIYERADRKTVSLETREKIRQKALGKKRSNEFCENQRRRMLGNKYLLGFKFSEESKKKMSIRSKNRKANLGRKWDYMYKFNMAKSQYRRNLVKKFIKVSGVN